MSNPQANDVTHIVFRKGGEEVTIKVFDTTREEAIRIYELISLNDEVTFACAFVAGGGRI